MNLKYIVITSLIFNALLFVGLVKLDKKFENYTSSPYLNLIIPETNSHVRLELNRLYPSPYDKLGFIAQWKYPVDNGSDFDKQNQGVTKFGNTRSFTKSFDASLNWEHIELRENENKIS